MITLQALSEYLETLLLPNTFVDHCPNGLQVEGKPEIRTLACAVSASLAAIESAIALKADALIVHHGLFWNKDPLPVLHNKRLKLKRLLENDISLLGFHLPLDAHIELGNNWKAAQDLGWHQLEPFGFIGQKAIGVRGRFKEMPIELFQKRLEQYYGHPAHVALGGPKVVSTVGLISGGAYREIEKAADLQLDCYVTGSFDEPVWDIAHERGIHFLGLGHYATERIGIRALGMHIEKALDVPCRFIDLANPF